MKNNSNITSNTCILGNCLEKMKDIPDNSIDLVVTSPPYFNLKEYSKWDNYSDYLEFIDMCFSDISRIIKEGRFVCWNIQDNIPNPTKDGRKYFALMPDTIKIAQKYGFEWECNIIWDKSNATQIMLGSYPYPPTMIYRQITESICIFRKHGKADLTNKKDIDKLDRETWSKYTKIIWTIQAQTKSKHSAPFPEEIPKRLIKLHSFSDDIVLDPFAGSGTTAIACINTNRNYICIELHENYFNIMQDRIAKHSVQEVLV